jgi:class 3 adenylate cyclase
MTIPTKQDLLSLRETDAQVEAQAGIKDLGRSGSVCEIRSFAPAASGFGFDLRQRFRARRAYSRPDQDPRRPSGARGSRRNRSWKDPVGEARKVAAILAADVAGFSRLTGADEEATLARMRALRSGLFNPAVEAHGGRVVKRTGDGVIVEFRSVVEAVRCAIDVTKGLAERNDALSPDRRIEVRTGIHLGDVVDEADGDLMGDGVNIAARLEGICEPGGVCLSEDAWRQVRDRMPETFVDLGEHRLKNIVRPMRAYALAGASRGRPAGRPAEASGAAPVRRERAPLGALVGAAAAALDNLGRLLDAYGDKAANSELRPVRAAGVGASGLEERSRRRRLRRAIIAAAILSVLAGRACTEQRSVAPPAPSPPRAGALEGPVAPRLSGDGR